MTSSDERLPVRLIYDRSTRQRSDLRNLPITLSNGRTVYLDELSEVEVGRGLSVINRRDPRRLVTVTAEVDDKVTPPLAVNDLMQQRFGGLSDGDYQLLFLGQKTEANESFRDMTRAGIIALAIIFFILGTQFRSLLDPLVVMPAIPFGVIGVVFAHALFARHLQFLSLIGLAALSGIVVNDSLILVDFAKRLHAQGMDRFDALVEAGRVRIRPILLTSITTFLGVSPLIFFATGQTAFLSPMAVSLGFGLMFATVLILVVLPCFYLIADDARTRVCSCLRRASGRPEPVPGAPCRSLRDAQPEERERWGRVVAGVCFALDCPRPPFTPDTALTTRLNALQQWLGTLGLAPFALAPASSDASFRRYFRLQFEDYSLIAMDAPPAQEDCAPFVGIARALAGIGVHVPEILQSDLEHGFVLMSDLGTQLYLSELNESNVDRLYGDAFGTLIVMQACGPGAYPIPPYDETLLRRELALFRDWYLDRHLGITLAPAMVRALAQVEDLLVANALAQPQVCVHRDYHSRNLLVNAAHNPGVLDFQDAVMGPVTYDVVSLLRDCYVSWPRAQVEEWVLGYHDLALHSGVLRDEDPERFLGWFDLMGVQRHLKATGIFARLNERDGKPGYLNDIPRTLGYVREVAGRYPRLAPLADLLAPLEAHAAR